MLPQLQAEQQLAEIEAASVPHMKPQTQRDVIRRHADVANSGRKPERATARGLAAIGITVEHVNAEGVPVSDGTAQDDTTVGGETT